MGLPKIIQIPCHYVLANQHALKLKKGAPIKQNFNINLGIDIMKKLLFCSYFRHISLCVYSNFNRESLLDAELNFPSNYYPLDILLTDLATPKTRNTWKTWWWCHHHVFQVFLVFGVAGSVKSMQCGYSLGCRIKFCIQQALLIEIWVKTQWDMLKIRTKKVVFFIFLLQN